MNSIFKEIDNLVLEKSEVCGFRKFCRTFLEKDPVFTEKLIPYIESEFACPKFQSKVVHIYTERCKNEQKKIIQEMQIRISHPNAIDFYKPQLDCVNEKLAVKTFPELIARITAEINKYSGIIEVLNKYYKSIHGTEDPEYIRNNYIMYYVGEILYGKYESNKARMKILDQMCSSDVLKEYTEIGFDLKAADEQFSKYKILSLNDHICINNDKDSQTLKDSRIDKYFWIDVPRKLLFSIEELISKKFVADISFRITHISDGIPAMEEMEFGSTLKLNISALPDLSKFYSIDNYENALWVHHDAAKNSLTFEELLEDFEVYGDDIVTQVVHLEYFSNNDNYFINHLDHELIVYSLEEYQEKIENPTKKGHKKIKTFKIDRARIPFFIKFHGEYFLLQVLDAYLKNTNLILEYFEKT